MTKWPDQPHYRFAGTYLGSDAHGDWIGLPTGTRFTRPGRDVTIPNDHVTLVPADDLDERGWLAAFHGPGGDFRLYVDIATPAVWNGTVLCSVDLDLDVVQAVDGRVWIDDEDEFADHRVRFEYPSEVAAGALASCTAIERAVRDGVPPFDGQAHLTWLDALRDSSQ